MRNLAGMLSTFRGRGERERQVASLLRDTCLSCDGDLTQEPLYQRLRVCPHCRFHYALTARERIDLLVDAASFRETHRSLISLDPLSFSSRVSYRQRLFRDQRRTGLTEAAVTGTCTIGRNSAVLVILDFSFLGGSMGCVVGEKVTLAMEQALKKRIPLVAVVTSGGARIQEGVLSLMQMAKTATAAARLHQAGLPSISILANPATGQAYASFANLADIILAEPSALIGFAPLRITQEAASEPLPSGAHTAESHLEHGLLDTVVDREQLRDHLSVLLDLLRSPFALAPARKKVQSPSREEGRATEAWQSVQLARHKERPTSRHYIQRILSGFLELHGDRSYGDDPAVVCGLGYLGGQGIAIIGQQNAADSPNAGYIYPEGFRKAQRVMQLAAKFGLPIVTLIDTPGASPSLEAEERGLGNAIATAMASMSQLPVPIVSAIIGEGGSEAALALGVVDRILMQENAIYSPISPEAAATLLYRDTARAQEVAESLRLTAVDCRELGIVDQVIPEPEGGAHTNPEEAARYLQRALMQELSLLSQRKPHRLVRDRQKRFRNMGEYSHHFRVAIAKEVDLLQGYVARGVRTLRRRRKGATEESSEDGEPS